MPASKKQINILSQKGGDNADLFLLDEITNNTDRISFIEDSLPNMRSIYDKVKGEKGDKGDTPIAGKDFPSFKQVQKFIEDNTKDIPSIIKNEVGKITVQDGYTPKKGKDYFTSDDVNEIIGRVIAEIPEPQQIDTRQVAVDAVNLLENFEGDDRLDASAIKNLEDNIDSSKLKIDSEGIKSDIMKALPKHPPQNAGGSGATFLASMRDIDKRLFKQATDGQVLGYDANIGKWKPVNNSGGGASELSDLSDVNTSTPTNRNVLVADGTDWESRALVEADISDLGSYITASSTDTLTNKSGSNSQWTNDEGYITDYTVTEADVTQHEAALSITESQISDLDHTDADAIHDNVAGEINAVTEKATPVSADLLLIEDSADSNNKKKVQIGNLPSSGGGDPDQNLYNSFTDGTNTATASTTTDTFKYRSANNILSVLVGNDDATHGDNLLLTVDETNIDHDNLTNYAVNEHRVWENSIAQNIHADNITEGSVTQHEGAIDHDALTNFVANEHIDHSSVSILSGDGLSGGGDITASRTLNVDINGTTDLASPATDDELLISDTSNANAIRKADLASIVNLADHDQLTNFSSDEHFTQASITTVGTVTTGSWQADDVGVSHGGTGASTASAARTNLGVAIGSDVQAHDAGLDDIASLAVTDGNIIVGDGSNWVAESGSTARSSLGLAIGSDVQAHDDILDDLSGLTQASDKVPYFDSSTTAGVLDFLDEDDLSSDSATALASQQSIKAYVDANSGGGTLDQSYDEGGSGSGRSITADSGAVEITVPDTSNNAGLVINQNDVTNHPLGLKIDMEASLNNGIQIISTEEDFSGGGSTIEFFKDQTTPADFHQIGQIFFYGRDSAANKQLYAKIGVESADITSGTEDSYIFWQTNLAGSNDTRAILGDGINGLKVGATTAAGILSSNGSQDLTLQTGNATTGNITITDGADGDITIAPDGTGDIDASSSVIKNVTDPTNDQDAATKKYVDDNSGGGFTPSSRHSMFLHSAQYYSTLTSGTGSLEINNNEKLRLETGATSSSSVFALAGSSGFNAFSSSPSFSAHFITFPQASSGLEGFIGFGNSAGAIDQASIGFKIESVDSSTRSLFAYQHDGTTENKSSQLTTFGSNESVEVALKVNGTSSVDYYYQVNGGGWSSATNLTSNLPTIDVDFWFKVGLDDSAAGENDILDVYSFTYER